MLSIMQRTSINAIIVKVHLETQHRELKLFVLRILLIVTAVF
jgi:hypothetical protein